jgi:hypothetical protein
LATNSSLQLLCTSSRTMSKRGPLDAYFTKLPGPNKKAKADGVEAQESSKVGSPVARRRRKMLQVGAVVTTCGISKPGLHCMQLFAVRAGKVVCGCECVPGCLGRAWCVVAQQEQHRVAAGNLEGSQGPSLAAVL